MSELAPAKVRVELFREPKFFDDHFCKGWSKTSGGTSSFALDGDLVTVNKGDVSEGIIERTFSVILTSVYPKFQIRAASVSGYYSVQVWGGASWLDVAIGITSAGLYECDLPSGQMITKIRLIAGGTSGIVSFDYVAICKNALLVPDLGDLVEELTVTRPVLSKGIAGAQFSIPNFAPLGIGQGEYTGLIKGYDIVIIWLARNEANLGDPAYKVFGGRVVTPTNRGVRYGEFYIHLDCHGHAYELNIPPALLQKSYGAMNGRTIIEESLALCNYLTKHPVASKWFDNMGSSGSTDDRINSTHDCVYDEENPMKVTQEISEKATNPAGVQGFDIYETPSGVLVGHLKNSLDFVSPIASITPGSYQKTEDFHRIRNKIKVYGIAEKTTPSDKDAWTESITNWTSNGILSTDADKVEGSCSVKSIFNGYPVEVWMKRSNIGNIKALFSKQNKKFNFHFKPLSTTKGPVGFNLLIYLSTGDGSQYFERWLFFPNSRLDENEFIDVSLPIGPDAEASLPTLGWDKFGAADWENITSILIYLSITGAASGIVTLKIDRKYFSGERFSGEAEDSSSQTAYGVRCDEPIVDDSLLSDDECQARAESLLAVLKDPVMILENVTVDGDHPYNPGDRQRTIVTNDNLDAYFRIMQVKHVVRGTIWDSVLTLSNEPQYLDYVFRLLQQAMKLLEKRT